MDLTDDQKKQILNELEAIMLVEDMPIHQIPDNPELMTSLQEKFAGLNLTVEIVKNLIENRGKVESVKNTSIANRVESINKNEMTVIDIYEPSKTSKHEIVNPIMEKNAIIPTSDFIDAKRFDQLLPIAEKYFDGSHISRTKNGDWLNSSFARDVICFMNNVSVRIDTKFVQVPRIDDVMVVCVCSIYDQFRNALVEGVTKIGYLYRRRLTDPNDPESRAEESFGGDNSAVEKCGTEALRRAVDALIPKFWQKEIIKIINKKVGLGDQNQTQSQKSTKKPSTNTPSPSVIR